LPPAAGSLDNRVRSESFQMIGTLTTGGLRQSAVPFGDEPSQFIAEGEEFLDALIEAIEALADERPNAVRSIEDRDPLASNLAADCQIVNIITIYNYHN
jgi:hypothetical protein